MQVSAIKYLCLEADSVLKIKISFIQKTIKKKLEVYALILLYLFMCR